MSKIFNTKILLIVIAVLLAILALSKFQSEKTDNTFNEAFANIDSTSVNQILIYPKQEKGKEIKIKRNGKNWELQFDKLKSSADNDAVRNLLAAFER